MGGVPAAGVSGKGAITWVHDPFLSSLTESRSCSNLNGIPTITNNDPLAGIGPATHVLKCPKNGKKDGMPGTSPGMGGIESARSAPFATEFAEPDSLGTSPGMTISVARVILGDRV